MQTLIPLLQNVRVASPCDASWEGMEAIDGERVKFCLHCAKNVYNLSELTQGEAEGLLRKHEGKLCVRYYQRQDGTVLTRDCPIGAQAVRLGLIRRSTVAAGMFAMLFGAMAAVSLSGDSPTPEVTQTPVVARQAVAGGISIQMAPPVKPEPPTPIMGAMMPLPARMGKMAALPPRHAVSGQTARLEHEGEDNLPIPDKPHDFDEAPEKDSADQAILNPRK